MPDEVPPNISQVFKDVIPFTLSVVSLYALDLLARHFVGASVAESIGKFFAPLFSAADGYLGITIIFGAFAFFWFVGIHGPSIVEPAIAAITYANAEVNLNLLQQVCTLTRFLLLVHKCLSLPWVVLVRHWLFHSCSCG